MAAWDNQTSAGLAPRLRIAHLLCWTVASAFGFAAYRGITPSLAPGVYIGIGVYDSVMGLALGTILTGVSIMAYRRWRDGMPYPSLPGHWLLVFGLAAAVADSVAIGVFEIPHPPLLPALEVGAGYGQPAEGAPCPVPYIETPGPDLCLSPGCRMGAGSGGSPGLSWHLRRRLSWPWLSVFVVFGLAAATLSAGHVRSLILIRDASTLSPIGPWCLQSAHVYARFVLLGVFMVLAAIAWDVRSRARVDGLHWVGIATWLVTASLQYATYRLIF